MSALYAILASLIVTSISILAIIPLMLKKKISDRLLLFLLSVSVGALLSVVFMDFLPEASSHGYTLGLALSIIGGFVFMLVVEKFIHHEHDTHNHSKKTKHGVHSHAYALAPINLVGEAIHNFIDGLVIAGAFAINISLGITATISIMLHEIPQEIADFGILLYSGLSRKKAVIFNLLSGASALIGTIVGILLAGKLSWFTSFIIPFAAGNFLYIAASNLVPQLHRNCDPMDSLMHITAIGLGVGIIVLLVLYGPAHVHA